MISIEIRTRTGDLLTTMIMNNPEVPAFAEGCFSGEVARTGLIFMAHVFKGSRLIMGIPCIQKGTPPSPFTELTFDSLAAVTGGYIHLDKNFSASFEAELKEQDLPQPTFISRN